MTDAQVTEALTRLKIKDPKKRKPQRERYAGMIALGRANRTLKVLEVRGRIRAGLWDFASAQHFPGASARIVEFALDARDPLARRWLKAEIKKRKYGPKTFLFLDRSRFSLLPDLDRLGFSIESVIQTGKPRPALTALMKRHCPPKDLANLGLRVEKVTRKHIAEIQRLHRKEFARNPQHGWFAGKAPFLKQLKEDITQEIKKPEHSEYVILNGKKVVGYFAATTGFQQARATAGVTFTFDQSIQGRGVLKTAYRILLEDMRRRKIKSFTGGTSQKAVLALGKLMKREPQFYILRFGRGHFDRRYFLG